MMDRPAEEPSFDELKRLIHEARTEGRNEAIGQLVAKFQEYVRRSARARLARDRSKFESLDIQQDVLVDVIERIRASNEVLRTEEEFLRLLDVMTLNRLRDLIKFYRRKLRDVRLEHRIGSADPGEGRIGDLEAHDPRDDRPGVSTEVMHRERQEQFEEFLKLLGRTLPPLQFHVFRRRHLDGASIAEIAGEIGKEPGAVKQLLFRARKSIREEFGRSGFSL
jgi:RNA polymerase sigma factor (sigma-70 family)